MVWKNARKDGIKEKSEREIELDKLNQSYDEFLRCMAEGYVKREEREKRDKLNRSEDNGERKESIFKSTA